MGFAILNGEIIERVNAFVDVEDRGYQFGDGVYEVIRVYNGRMFTAKEHLRRFVRSAESICITIPYPTEQLMSLLEKLIQKNSLQQGIIYLQISRGITPRNHAFPVGDVAPTLVAYTKEVDRPVEKLKSGVKTILVEDIRWLRCDIKSLNLLANVLAKQKAAEANCFEAIQYRGRDITEGSSSNIFIVKDGVVITHPSTNLILKGITKDKILRLCTANAIAVVERTFTLEELMQADEAFLSSTTGEVMPIIEIEKKIVKDGVPGPVTRRLQAFFEEEIKSKCGNL
jgi:D-alanine transaminase